MKAINMVFILLILVYSVTILNAQSQIYSEAPIIFENGVKKSVQVTVHFNSNVFALPKGEKYAEISDANHIYSDVINTLVSLQQKYGEVVLKKQIPAAVWGDIWRKKITNGEMVKINDMSQLFTL